jgi:hypothetical protein
LGEGLGVRARGEGCNVGDGAGVADSSGIVIVTLGEEVKVGLGWQAARRRRVQAIINGHARAGAFERAT